MWLLSSSQRYGFRKPPYVELKARPKLGEREVTLVHVTEWIEKKLEQELQVKRPVFPTECKSTEWNGGPGLHHDADPPGELHRHHPSRKHLCSGLGLIF